MRLWCILLVMVSFACDRTQPSVAPERPIQVAAAVYAVTDIARQVGGSDVQTLWALESPASIDQYQPAPGELDSLRAADLLIVSGAIDAWVLESAGSVQRERGLIRLNVLPGAASAPASALWIDPVAAAALADEVVETLSARRPRHRQQFESAARQFKDSLAAVQTSSESQLSPLSGKQVATLSPAFDALLLRYKIVPVRLGQTPPHQLTNEQLFELKQAAAKAEIRWLVVDASLPESMVQVISTRTGLGVLRIELLGSSSGASPVKSYVDVCRHNLQELLKLKDQ